MLKEHPLLEEKSSYKQKYLNVLEYFQKKYAENDLWAKQTFRLYVKTFLGDEKAYQHGDFNNSKRQVLSTKFRPFKFFSYRYCLIFDCIFICAYGGKEKSKKIFNELV